MNVRCKAAVFESVESWRKLFSDLLMAGTYFRAKVTSSQSDNAKMQEQAQSRYAQEVTQQITQRALEECMALQQAAEEEQEAAAIGAKQEATRGAEQEEKEEAAEEAQAEMDEKAKLDELWLGKLRRAKPRYTPDSTLAPGCSRWGKGTQLLETQPMVQHRIQDLFESLICWELARRVGFREYKNGTFIREAHRWNVQCQKLLTKQNALHTTHNTLSQDVPPRFKSAVGDRIKEVNDMVNNHLGEVRELDGAWVRMDGEVPKPWTDEGRVFYHAQYALTRSQFQKLSQDGPANLDELPDHTADEEGRYNSILAHQPPAFGDEDQESSFRVRVCRIISLAELFWFFGSKYTAHELYAYYVHARRLVLMKPHSPTNAERRVQVVAHYQSTGRWGMGNVAVDELVRK